MVQTMLHVEPPIVFGETACGCETCRLPEASLLVWYPGEYGLRFLVLDSGNVPVPVMFLHKCPFV